MTEFADLPAVGSVEDEDEILLVQGGVGKRAAISDLPAPVGGAGATIEEVQDNLGTSFLVPGANIDGTYDDSAGTYTLDVVGVEPSGTTATHAAKTTTVHGIANTAALETTTGAQTKATTAKNAAESTAAAALSAHNAASNPHPGYLTPAEGDAAYEEIGAVAAHSADTTAVHGITDTASLETLSGAQTKADAARSAAESTAASALSAHAAAGDPHPGYLTPAEGDAAYEALGGIATHSADTTAVHGITNTAALETTSGAQTKADDAQAAAEATADSALVDHSNAADPHPVYLTAAEGGASYEPAGSVASHAAAPDPHPGYLTPAEGAAAYEALGSVGAHSADSTAVHGIADTAALETLSGAQSKANAAQAAAESTAATALTDHGNAADPHPGYLTPAEGDAAYEALGASDAAVSAHAGAGDPHPGYLTPAEGAAAYEPVGAVSAHEADTTDIHGIANTALLETTAGAQSKADDAQTAAESTAAAALSGHAAAPDPHPGYLTPAEGAAAYEPTGAVAAHTGDAVDAHDASAVSVDPAGLTFVTTTDVQSALGELDAASGGASAVADHEAIATDAHDASAISLLDSGGKYTAVNVETALAEVRDVADTAAGGGITIEQVQDNIATSFLVAGTSLSKSYNDAANTMTLSVDAGDFDPSGTSAAHAAGTTGVHGIPDTSALLDTDDVGSTVQAWAAVLDGTTAAYTAADETKLDGIEAGATADQTGAEIKAAYEAEADTNAFTDVEQAKLGGIQDGATVDQTPTEILDALLTVDGAGSLLDADRLDNIEASGFYQLGGTDVAVSDGGTGASTAAGARTGLGLVIGTDVQAFSSILQNTTASFTTADETKLDGIQDGATVDQTGADIKALYEAEADTNAFTDAEQTKLAGVEALADVTDATNVAAAGAVMETDTDASTWSFVTDSSDLSQNRLTHVVLEQHAKGAIDAAIAANATTAPPEDLGNWGTTKALDLDVSRTFYLTLNTADPTLTFSNVPVRADVTVIWENDIVGSPDFSTLSPEYDGDYPPQYDTEIGQVNAVVFSTRDTGTSWTVWPTDPIQKLEVKDQGASTYTVTEADQTKNLRSTVACTYTLNETPKIGTVVIITAWHATGDTIQAGGTGVLRPTAGPLSLAQYKDAVAKKMTATDWKVTIET